MRRNDTEAAVLGFDEIPIGGTFTIVRTFDLNDVLAFARLSGDFSPLHVDEQYAATTEFGGRVVHGMLLASLFSQLVGMWVPGRHALYLGQDLAFRKPVLVGETVSAVAKVTGKNAPTRTLLLSTEIRDSQNRVVVSGSAKVKVRDGAGATTAVAEPTALPATGKPVAIVTGASRGLGAAIAERLASQGIAVAVNYHQRADLANRLVDAICSRGGRAAAIQADICTSDGVRDLLATTREKLGPATLLVNNASTELDQTPATELEWNVVERQLAYQVKAVLEMCQQAHPAMKSAGGGAIVNVVSQVVEGVPPPRMAAYVCAKHALVGLSRALAVEWAGDQIRVNMVSPGLNRTDLTQHYHERLFQMEAARVPLRRLCEPADVAGVVSFLLSEEARFLTGVNLPVTGGLSMP
jgi:3-oxoacyl-[acyl-carrier protein] reductase